MTGHAPSQDEPVQHIGRITIDFDAGGRVVAKHGQHIRKVGRNPYAEENRGFFHVGGGDNPMAGLQDAIEWYKTSLAEAEEKDRSVATLTLRVRGTADEVRDAVRARLGEAAVLDIRSEPA